MKERPVSKEEAKLIGDKLGIDWKDINLDEFRRGLEVEQEHGSMLGSITDITHDDPLLTGRIALAHLKEIADYYTLLDELEAETEEE